MNQESNTNRNDHVSELGNTNLKALYLPSHIFHSKFTFIVHQYWRYLVNRLITISFVVASGLCLIVSSKAVIAINILSFAVCIISFVVVLSINCETVPKLQRLEWDTKRKLLIEIIDKEPIIDSGTWDIIATRLNKYRVDEGFTTNPYSIYDGKECIDLFNSLLTGLKCTSMTPKELAKSYTSQSENSTEQEIKNLTDLENDILRELALQAQDVLRQSLENKRPAIKISQPPLREVNSD